MVPAELIESGLDDSCVRLFALVDSYPTMLGPVTGISRVAKKLGWRPTKVSDHLRHLEERGLVRVSRAGHKQAAIEVSWNPSRTGLPRSQAFLPEVPRRFKKPSPMATRPAESAGANPRKARVKPGDCPAESAPQSDSKRYVREDWVGGPELEAVTSDGNETPEPSWPDPSEEFGAVVAAAQPPDPGWNPDEPPPWEQP